jgi:hydrogenase/urease accessory protein HupE
VLGLRHNLGQAITVALVTLAAASAQAHAFGKSFSDTKPMGADVSVFFDFDPDDLEETLRAQLDDDHSGMIDVPEMEAHLPILAKLVEAGFVVERDGERCPSEILAQKVNPEARMVRVRLVYHCASEAPLTLRMPLLERLKDGHVHLATLRLLSGMRAEALTRPHPEWSEVYNPGVLAWRFLVAGIGHILGGYDHLLFLLALLLVARTFRQILLIVTSFTLAHSVTLVLAGLDVVSLPSRLVEPAIAATIVIVGAENLWRKQAPSHRPLLTFGLGLIHGFGFASVLREMSLPATGRLVPLLSFNLGVELGQIAVVVTVLPLIRWLERQLGPWVVKGGSIAVVVLGSVWLVLRVAGVNV